MWEGYFEIAEIDTVNAGINPALLNFSYTSLLYCIMEEFAIHYFDESIFSSLALKKLDFPFFYKNTVPNRRLL